MTLAFSTRRLVHIALIALLAIIAIWMLGWQPAFHWQWPSGARLWGVIGALLSWLLICVWQGVKWFRQQKAYHRQANRVLHQLQGNNPPWLILHASQTGVADQLARWTAQALNEAATPTQCLPLGQANLSLLQRAEKVLFIVSTTGDGDAPDTAQPFVQQIMAATHSLPRLQYGLLALGDSQYDDFCGFGRYLDAWLTRCDAVACFPAIEVDREAPAALQQWQSALSQLIDNPLAAPKAPVFTSWQLRQRRTLNPHSQEGTCFLIDLQTDDSITWQAGDIAVVKVTDANGNPDKREYSIASLPTEGSLQLLVRRMTTADGELGVGSALLTRDINEGDEVSLYIRPHPSFHPPTDEAPVILIGNGTGMAGLRAQLAARIHAGCYNNWLLFGERHRQQDFYYQDDINRWQDNGQLAHCDTVFSRDQEERIYVQHLLANQPQRLNGLIAQNATLYVCGSLDMGKAVDTTLAKLLGPATLQQLTAAGRYRRDVY